MTDTVTIRKRGFFGWICLITFLLFQALMIYITFFNIEMASELVSDCPEDELSAAACLAGTAIGAGITSFIGWTVWILGTVILGFLALMTRGKLITKPINK